MGYTDHTVLCDGQWDVGSAKQMTSLANLYFTCSYTHLKCSTGKLVEPANGCQHSCHLILGSSDDAKSGPNSLVCGECKHFSALF